jgi:6-phospho-3-hexuloisomerase
MSEIKSVVELMDEEQLNLFALEIINHKGNIILVGAGRVGYALKGFGMRLSHLGFKSYFLGDSNVPSITTKDILLVASGSGETQTVYDVVKIAHSKGSKIICLTSNPISRIGLLAHHKVIMSTPSKNNSNNIVKTVQPMTTLNEQCLVILFDALVLHMMNVLNETNFSMWSRHSNLE